jgi:hypothetical protein
MAPLPNLRCCRRSTLRSAVRDGGANLRAYFWFWHWLGTGVVGMGTMTEGSSSAMRCSSASFDLMVEGG